ncbi:MAG: hypothetical protein U5K56_18435 [Halioglobus sp.]|nr:hypothetical protein [Halioglobus sp.]
MGNLAQFSRAQLARLGREYMLAAQLNSRTGYAGLRINHGDAAYRDTAIDNWMSASPIYTRRMQRAMGFAGGTDVATIFKGLQLECGFSHQYFDVHFEVESAEQGRFWLQSCGALLEAEPRGEEAVRVMCHDIEDPTFDATAVATNPRARMRPVHRPPRVPANRTPHCEWQVFIDHEAEPLEETDLCRRMGQTELARLDIPRPPNAEPGGMDDYSGPLLEQLELERLSHGALVAVCSELALQNHLLINSLLLVIAARYGEEAAHAVAEFQMIGSARVLSERLCNWIEDKSADIDRLIAVLDVHPALQPREYFAPEVERLDDRRVRLVFGDGPARHENQPFGWYPLLVRGTDAGLESLARGVVPGAVLRRSEAAPMAWDIELDNASVEEEPLPVRVARGTVLYNTQFRDHIPLLQV